MAAHSVTARGAIGDPNHNLICAIFFCPTSTPKGLISATLERDIPFSKPFAYQTHRNCQ